METNLFSFELPEYTYVFDVSGDTSYDDLRQFFKYKVARYLEGNKVYFWGPKNSLTQGRELSKVDTGSVKSNIIQGIANDAISVSLRGKGLRQTRRAFYPTARSSSGLRIDARPGNVFVHDAIEFKIESETVGSNQLSLLATQVITVDGENYRPEFSKQHSPSVRDAWTLASYTEAHKRWLAYLQPSIEYGAGELGSLTVTIPSSGGAVVKVDEQAEPKVTFNVGSDMTHNWPEGGLKAFGPLDYNLGDSKPQIKIALIAGGYQKPFSLDYLKALNEGSGRYQGFEAVYKAPLILKENGKYERLQVIDPTKIQNASTIEEVANLYLQALVDIKNRNSDFDVAIIEIPAVLVNKFAGSPIDLRDYLKTVFLQQQVATQFLAESTINKNPEYTLPNFSLGLYVSAGGVPWRIEEHPADTAYLGISFGIRKEGNGDSKILVGVAEIMDEYGVSLGIKAVGEKYDAERGVHLTSASIKAVISNLLEQYKADMSSYPQRVVVHKTSSYNEDEEAVVDVFNEKNIDVVLLHIYPTKIRVIEDVGLKIKRGMTWKINESTALLYTDGILSYTGKSLTAWTPNPLIIERFAGTEDIQVSARHILCLTKLNWNATRNHEKNPVTLSHSQKVIDLLRAGLDRSTIIDDFRYYF